MLGASEGEGKVLVLDFGGSSTKFGLVGNEGTICARGRLAAPRASEEDFLGVVRDALEAAGQPVRGIAISLGGNLDRRTGVVVSSGQFLYLRGQSVMDVVHKVFDGPVTVVHDGYAAGLAEMRLGSLRGVDYGLVLVLGTGIGSAIVLGGQIYEGAHFCAGEYSLVRVDGTRSLDSVWARRGGGVGLTDFVREFCGIDEPGFDGPEVFRRAEAGDKDVRAALEAFCENFAVQAYNAQAVLDVDRIAIGGGVSAQPLLLELVRKHLHAIFEAERDLHLTVQEPELVACAFRNDAQHPGCLAGLLRASVGAQEGRGRRMRSLGAADDRGPSRLEGGARGERLPPARALSRRGLSPCHA